MLFAEKPFDYSAEKIESARVKAAAEVAADLQPELDAALLDLYRSVLGVFHAIGVFRDHLAIRAKLGATNVDAASVGDTARWRCGRCLHFRRQPSWTWWRCDTSKSDGSFPQLAEEIADLQSQFVEAE